MSLIIVKWTVLKSRSIKPTRVSPPGRVHAASPVFQVLLCFHSVQTVWPWNFSLFTQDTLTYSVYLLGTQVPLRTCNWRLAKVNKTNMTSGLILHKRHNTSFSLDGWTISLVKRLMMMCFIKLNVGVGPEPLSLGFIGLSNTAKVFTR